jgi:AhpD family alkylhydroperoxidase
MSATATLPAEAASRPTIQPRLVNPASIVPETMKGIQVLLSATHKGGVSTTILELSHLRASQINGCSFCVDIGSRMAKKGGETDERLFGVAAWRESPHFTHAERAALALTEALTRIADRPDPVPDSVWEEAAAHYDEAQLAALVVAIAAINAFNRVNAATRQITGDWVSQYVGHRDPADQAA